MKLGRALAMMGGFLATVWCHGVALAAEEHAVDAFATWEGRGQIYQVGTGTAVFVGAFTGTLFVSANADLRPGGSLVCPATIELDLVKGSMSGNGRCVIAGAPGERLYATWSCKGEFGKGCDGQFTLTEGTGEWQGVVGGGPFSAQSDLQVLAATPGNVISQSAKGVMVWRGFRYQLP